MNLVHLVRSRLSAKLFLTYLAIIGVLLLVLGIAVTLAVPAAINRQMATMLGLLPTATAEAHGMGQGMGSGMGPGMGEGMSHNLANGFRAAIFDALWLAALAALGAALLASLYISRRVSAPIHAMQTASQRIAEGHYNERLSFVEGSPPEQQDELGRLAHSFNQMAARLDETEHLRLRLIGDVTHELRTPLTTIKGSMEGLIDGVLPATPETYQAVFHEAERLSRLVDDLQELSRVEAGAYQLAFSPVAPADLFHSLHKRLERQYAEKGVSLAINLPPGLPSVRADADRIGQVLLNLAGNALQYTPSGGKVSVSANLHGAEVHFTIQDTGLGIPAEHLPHLFTRFYRVDKSRSRAGGGSGIGLTIARHLVEAHGGRIWVASPGAGQGSTFTFSLPVAD